mmetsp:Transcript_17070/g.36833  ORF Transcript_17070/g.36833 Transcript_17070/m.36833 type:complete len:92 (-) Transcript_17070:311-586(-)
MSCGPVILLMFALIEKALFFTMLKTKKIRIRLIPSINPNLKRVYTVRTIGLAQIIYIHGIKGTESFSITGGFDPNFGEVRVHKVAVGLLLL